jgi:putative glutamine amidotransferase
VSLALACPRGGRYTVYVTVRIAIPIPTLQDEAYNQRTLPPYVAAVEACGAQVVEIPLALPQDKIASLLNSTHGVLLPGSRFDVEPERYGELRQPECHDSDPARTAVDELLLQDAFNLRKPVLGICQGTQSLNVWRGGKLVQDLQTKVNHHPGRTIVEAHSLEIVAGSRLAALLPSGSSLTVLVNSTHHQAIRVAGDGLRVVAVSPADGVIEAVELDSREHFVLGVQWHPERTRAESALSCALFAALVREAKAWKAPAMDAGRTQG